MVQGSYGSSYNYSSSEVMMSPMSLEQLDPAIAGIGAICVSPLLEPALLGGTSSGSSGGAGGGGASSGNSGGAGGGSAFSWEQALASLRGAAASAPQSSSLPSVADTDRERAMAASAATAAALDVEAAQHTEHIARLSRTASGVASGNADDDDGGQPAVGLGLFQFGFDVRRIVGVFDARLNQK